MILVKFVSDLLPFCGSWGLCGYIIHNSGDSIHCDDLGYHFLYSVKRDVFTRYSWFSSHKVICDEGPDSYSSGTTWYISERGSVQMNWYKHYRHLTYCLGKASIGQNLLSQEVSLSHCGYNHGRELGEGDLMNRVLNQGTKNKDNSVDAV